MTPGSLVNLGSDTSNAGNGSIDRSESINLTPGGAWWRRVLPNGNFVIDGRQQVRVNNEMRDLKVSGIVRAEDITQDNTVIPGPDRRSPHLLWRRRHGQRCPAAALWQPPAL